MRKPKVFRRGNVYIAYDRELDLSACGNTREEAERNFREMLRLHVETCAEIEARERERVVHNAVTSFFQEFDLDRAANAYMYIHDNMDKVYLYNVLRLLYCADRIHMKRYGLSITGDMWKPASVGITPIPSHISDLLKYISDKKVCDKSYLSESNIECLECVMMMAVPLPHNTH